MKHKVYKKIRALWNVENEWILNGTVIVQEKIDGANLSIWYDEWIYVWSRNKTVWTPTQRTWFRWATDYANDHPWIRNLMFQLYLDYPWAELRLYWEWLVKHTIWSYNPEAYNHFYLFDIEIDGVLLNAELVSSLAKEFWIKTPKIFWIFENPTDEEVRQFVGASDIWPVWEWVVIKNENYVNKFWDKVYAKIVWDKFKEENMVTFWGMQKGDNEMKIVLKYCTNGRVRKIIHKIEQNDDKDIHMNDISKIIWFTQRDIITEEAWNISKIWTIDFKRLKGLLWKRTVKIAISIINNEPVSVAFEDNI